MARERARSASRATNRGPEAVGGVGDAPSTRAAPITRTAVAQACAVAIELLLGYLEHQLGRGPTALVSQRDSPLGPKRHCRAVRDRIRTGLGGAYVQGRDYLLTVIALQETLSGARATAQPEHHTDEADAMADGLGLARSSDGHGTAPTWSRGRRGGSFDAA